MKKPQTPPEFQAKQRTLFQRKAKLIEKATESELIFKKRLEDAGIRFMFQKGYIAGDFYCIVDFYIPKPHRTAIEIDGPYHAADEQKRKDWAKDKYLNSRKIKVIRIKNEDVNIFDLTPYLTK